MQATTDPGEVSSENLAASIAGEIERLRFAILEMKATPQWYTSTITRAEAIPAQTQSGFNAWQDAVTEVVTVYWRVPESWVSGTNVTFRFFRRADATGTAVMEYTTARARDATAYHSIFASGANFVAADTITHAYDITIAAAEYILGDTLIVILSRLGGHGSDTIAANVRFDGVQAIWTGYAGRP